MATRARSGDDGRIEAATMSAPAPTMPTQATVSAHGVFQGAASGLAALGARVVFAGLEKRYGSVAAVDGVSLDVAPGEFVTLLGPSGSGKTTSLLMLAGFERPTAGEIYVDDRPIADVP